MKFFKVMKCIVAGDWHGVEVHDHAVLRKYVVYAIGAVFLIGLGAGIKSCAAPPCEEFPPHVQVNG